MNLTSKETKKGPAIELVSFDVPYPPNYGGVIDVFYKLKALYAEGVKITLHTFEYGRGEHKELEKYCEKVYYYQRNNFYKSTLSFLPFIVKTRQNYLLGKRLEQSVNPILFEGLHTTFLLSENKLKGVKIIIRVHNIEHEYYLGLAKSETSLFKKFFFIVEAFKLKKYQTILEKADHILTISPPEQYYFSNLFGDKSNYLPVFTNTSFTDLLPEEEFILWHGDLKVSDNVRSVLFAIELIKNTSHKLVVASSCKSTKIKKICQNYDNVFFDSLENNNALEILLLKAKVNLLFTYQATGIKLKLLNTLVKSRFVVTNDLMIKETGLESLCVVANSGKEVIVKLNELMSTTFTEFERNKRKELLMDFDVAKNAKKIIDLL